MIGQALTTVALVLLTGAVVWTGLVTLRSRQEPDVQAPTDADVLLLDRLRERFVVTLTTGETFSGLLDEVDDRSVVLVNGSVMKPDGVVLPVDGELVLRRDAVAYMQRP